MSGPGGAGFFGKLPGVGDFVQRRLPAAFVAGWDANFEAAVNAARNGFGADWHAAWQAAPVWRFALMPGVCGDSAWVGVTGPSTDRVGRGFPMVLAHAIDDAAVLTRVVRAAGGWFAAAEDVCRHARAGAATTTETFDAMVCALPSPLAWLEEDATEAVAAAWRDTLRVAWRQDGEDRQLAALWARCREAGDGCMWWTSGGARTAPSVRLTHGLPTAHDYADFLADATTGLHPQPGAAFAPLPASADSHGVISNATSTGDIDDVLADLLAPSQPALAPAPVPDGRDGDPRTETEYPNALARTTEPVASGVEGRITLIAADNGPTDPRRIAAARVMEMLADPAALADMQHVRDCLMALHPQLHARSEDLIDPVPEDAAVMIARITDDCVELLRAGAAGAWHWRRGQLRPLFVADADPAADEAETVQPGDLSGILSQPPARHAPGIGSANDLRLDEAHCTVVNGDRLLLMATDTLVRLPDDALASALQAASGDEACAWIAAAAGLPMERAQWPVAVIEVGT